MRRALTGEHFEKETLGGRPIDCDQLVIHLVYIDSAHHSVGVPAPRRWFAQSGLLPIDMEDADLYKTNLVKVLGETPGGFSEERPIFVVIDQFHRVPMDLALIVCNELRAIDDLRQQDRGRPLRGIRFVIGGAIDLVRIYGDRVPAGVSPGTNFCKYRPYNLLLSAQETSDLLDADFPSLSKLSPSMYEFVYDCTGGAGLGQGWRR